MPERKHLVADGLSRRSWTADDDISSEESVEEFLNSQFLVAGVHSFNIFLAASVEETALESESDLPGVTPGRFTKSACEDISVLNPEFKYSESHI